MYSKTVFSTITQSALHIDQLKVNEMMQGLELSCSCCRHCGSKQRHKWGRPRPNDLRQRYRCLSCGRTYTCTTGTALHRIKKMDIFLDFMHLMSKGRITLKRLRKSTGVCMETAHMYRLRAMTAHVLFACQQQEGLVEQGEMELAHSRKGQQQRKAQGSGCPPTRVGYSRQLGCPPMYMPGTPPKGNSLSPSSRREVPLCEQRMAKEKGKLKSWLQEVFRGVSSCYQVGYLCWNRWLEFGADPVQCFVQMLQTNGAWELRRFLMESEIEAGLELGAAAARGELSASVLKKRLAQVRESAKVDPVSINRESSQH